LTSGPPSPSDPSSHLLLALGETLAKEHLIVKRSEVGAFCGTDAAFEIDQHFYRF
jgi:hypothetical protein